MNTKTEYISTMNTKLVIVIFLLTFFFTLKKQAYPNQEKNSALHWCIQNPSEHLRWRVLLKQLTVEHKNSTFRNLVKQLKWS